MPDRHGKTTDVRSIYRRGDRALVELGPWFYLLEVRSWEIIQGELWLHAIVGAITLPFPAACVVRRLATGECFTWSMLRSGECFTWSMLR